ncbi:hypothetical protein BRC86_11265 [Halobacteriales archaeon QS_3_64_16]|nr:MAG: hypothetical protein BRC86_11265 [Halobacteriales archaeon QS_3_64_16]
MADVTSDILVFLLGVVGLLEVLFPRQVLVVALRFMFESPEVPEGIELKPWVRTVARLERLAFVLLALYRRTPSRSAA